MSSQRRGVSPGNILVVTDSHADAALIQQMLGAEFAAVHVSTDPDKALEDVARYLPQVLVLAFDRIELAEQYNLALFRQGCATRLPPHRVILLCGKDDLKRAYQLCQCRQFDDYNLFWPMTNDVSRLPMSVHLVLRELAASLAASLAAGGGEGEGAGRLAAMALLQAQLQPKPAVPAVAAPEPQPAAQLPESAPGSAPIVLLVDDDEMTHRLAGAILKDEGYRLVFVSSALEAMKVLRTMRPDLILMDIQMPDLDGMAAIRQIKADSRFAMVPVIMITGHSDSDAVLGSFQCGAVDFIVKPFDKEKMIAKVAAALGREVSAWT